jgi:hypothetical protein
VFIAEPLGTWRERGDFRKVILCEEKIYAFPMRSLRLCSYYGHDLRRAPCVMRPSTGVVVIIFMKTHHTMEKKLIFVIKGNRLIAISEAVWMIKICNARDLSPIFQI